VKGRLGHLGRERERYPSHSGSLSLYLGLLGQSAADLGNEDPLMQN
jgi:hypothetical protein